MDRKGKLSEEESELQYDVIAKERQQIESKFQQIEFHNSMTEAYKEQYKEAGKILKEHYDLIEVAQHDLQVRYMLIQKFVRRVIIETFGTGRQKTFTVTAEYVLGGDRYLATPGDLTKVDGSMIGRDV